MGTGGTCPLSHPSLGAHPQPRSWVGSPYGAPLCPWGRHPRLEQPHEGCSSHPYSPQHLWDQGNPSRRLGLWLRVGLGGRGGRLDQRGPMVGGAKTPLAKGTGSEGGSRVGGGCYLQGDQSCHRDRGCQGSQSDPKKEQGGVRTSGTRSLLAVGDAPASERPGEQPPP